jgi:putative transposase
VPNHGEDSRGGAKCDAGCSGAYDRIGLDNFRRILHFNVTSHPTAEWTLQQFREAIPGDHSYRFLIHDRDSIFSAEVDETLASFGLKVLRTPVRAPKANASCEHLVSTIRRECWTS